MFESKKKHKILTTFSLGNTMTKKFFWASKIFSECADLLKDHFPKISNPYLYSNFWGVKKTWKMAIFTGFEITRFICWFLRILLKKSIFDYFFDFSLFFYESEISGKQINSKKISKMNTKVHKNNFRNFKCVNIIEIGWYFWS